MGGTMPKGEVNCIFNSVVVKENLLNFGDKEVSERIHSFWRKL
jgi:hypothetical protein